MPRPVYHVSCRCSPLSGINSSGSFFFTFNILNIFNIFFSSTWQDAHQVCSIYTYPAPPPTYLVGIETNPGPASLASGTSSARSASILPIAKKWIPVALEDPPADKLAYLLYLGQRECDKRLAAHNSNTPTKMFQAYPQDYRAALADINNELGLIGVEGCLSVCDHKRAHARALPSLANSVPSNGPNTLVATSFLGLFSGPIAAACPKCGSALYLTWAAPQFTQSGLCIQTCGKKMAHALRTMFFAGQEWATAAYITGSHAICPRGKKVHVISGYGHPDKVLPSNSRELGPLLEAVEFVFFVRVTGWRARTARRNGGAPAPTDNAATLQSKKSDARTSKSKNQPNNEPQTSLLSAHLEKLIESKVSSIIAEWSQKLALPVQSPQAAASLPALVETSPVPATHMLGSDDVEDTIAGTQRLNAQGESQAIISSQLRAEADEDDGANESDSAPTTLPHAQLKHRIVKRESPGRVKKTKR